MGQSTAMMLFGSMAVSGVDKRQRLMGSLSQLQLTVGAAALKIT
jgi:hypothetical protein